MSLLPATLMACLLVGPAQAQSNLPPASAAQNAACEHTLRDRAWRHLGEAVTATLQARGVSIRDMNIDQVERIALSPETVQLVLWALARDGSGELSLLHIQTRMNRHSLDLESIDYLAYGGDGQRVTLMATAP